ncbi:MAG: polyprenyl synthetase family protein [Bacteroidaceae bacterium]
MNKLEELNSLVSVELKEFNLLFSKAMSSDDKLLNMALSHVSSSRGKQIRPLMMFVLARIFGEVSEKAYSVALALELIHTATLVHDDIVDESAKRRGISSLNTKFGSKTAVLVGDYMLSTGLLSALRTDDLRIIGLASTLGQQLSSGEILQLENISNSLFSEEAYFNIIRKKTAVLFRTCAECILLTCENTKESVTYIADIVESIGLCFQIRDDIFDLIPSKKLGKPSGNDLLEGKLTLPVIHVLNKTQNKKLRDIAKKVKLGTATSDEMTLLSKAAIEDGGIDYAQKMMVQIIDEAISKIKGIDGNPIFINALCLFAEIVVQRQS